MQSSRETSTKDRWRELTPGTRVKHSRHGPGTVVGLADGKIQVDFDNRESHRYASHSYAKLEVLGPSLNERESESELQPSASPSSLPSSPMEEGVSGPQPTHFLLVCNKHTFIGAQGLELSLEVRAR